MLSVLLPKRRAAEQSSELITARTPLTMDTAAMLFLWTVAEGNQPRVINGELYATLGKTAIRHPLAALEKLEREKMILLPPGDGVTITNHGRKLLDRWKVKMYGSSKVRLMEVTARDPR